MSGGESDSYSLESPKLDAGTLAAIKDYAIVDPEGAKKLRLQSQLFKVSDGGDKQFVGYRYGGFQDQSIDELVAKFNDWRKKQSDTAEAHNQYVQMTNDRPGRGSTILVPQAGPASKTVIGDWNPGGTVIG